MINPRGVLVCAAASASLAVAAWLTEVQAHPHVWAKVKSTVVYQGGHIAGLRHEWSFDEGFTDAIKEEFDKNKDGKLSAAELAELVKLNMKALRDFKFFTIVESEGKALEFGQESDYSMEHVGKELVLRFTIALAAPVPRSKAFAFTVEDPTYFTSMQFAEVGDAIALGTGAPRDCQLAVEDRVPPAPDQQALMEAFSDVVSGGAMLVGNNKMVHVRCQPTG